MLNKAFAETDLFDSVSLWAVMGWDSVDSGVLSAVMGCVSVLFRAVLGWAPMVFATPLSRRRVRVVVKGIIY